MQNGESTLSSISCLPTYLATLKTTGVIHQVYSIFATHHVKVGLRIRKGAD
jgi:hypothetical protein